MKKLLWLFLLLHVSAAQASISSSLLRPLRAFYNGPYTSVVGFTSRVKARSTALPEEHTAEVHEVLREMGIDPGTIILRILEGHKRYINEYHSSGLVQLYDHVEAIGGILVFDKNFFQTIPKGQRRAVIAHEAWHIMHLNDLKSIASVLGGAGLVGVLCGLGGALISYHDSKDISSRIEQIDRMYETGVGTGIFTGIAGLIGFGMLQPYLNRSSVRAAEIYVAKALGCAQDTIDYHEAQLQRNNNVCDNFPQVDRITYRDGIEVSRERIRPAELYDTKGNYKHDIGNPPLTDRIAYLKELTAA